MVPLLLESMIWSIDLTSSTFVWYPRLFKRLNNSVELILPLLFLSILWKAWVYARKFSLTASVEGFVRGTGTGGALWDQEIFGWAVWTCAADAAGVVGVVVEVAFLLAETLLVGLISWFYTWTVVAALPVAAVVAGDVTATWVLA